MRIARHDHVANSYAQACDHEFICLLTASERVPKCVKSFDERYTGTTKEEWTKVRRVRAIQGMASLRVSVTSVLGSWVSFVLPSVGVIAHWIEKERRWLWRTGVVLQNVIMKFVRYRTGMIVSMLSFDAMGTSITPFTTVIDSSTIIGIQTWQFRSLSDRRHRHWEN